MRLSSVAAEQDLQEFGGLPIDRLAAIVTSRGVHFNPEKLKTNEQIYDAPPPPMGMNRAPWAKRPEDLKGVRVGRLTVVHYYGAKKSPIKRDERGRHVGGGHTEKQRWVCRCSCGLYVIRTSNALKRVNPDEEGLMCPVCRYVERLKKYEVYRRTGKWPDEHKTSC